MEQVLVLAAAYLMGSIPTAFLAGRLLKGIDIREHGSGNVGTTNAFRVLGKPAGVAVFAVDMLKGAVSVALAGAVGGPWLMDAAALAVIGGHTYPLFLGFRGGRGVATGAGILLYLCPVVLLVALALFAVVVLATRYVSLGSVTAAVSVPVLMLAFKEPVPVLILGLVAVVFIVYRHIPNIKRLLAGTENKIGGRLK